MTSSIHLQNPRERPLDQVRLKLAAQTALDQHQVPGNVCLTIVIADAPTLREYNRRHRQIDAATDVLSFPAPPLPAVIDPAQNDLGDIIIAYDYVKAQCAARGCCLSDLLCLLVIHGTLHLLGHDHESDAARIRMWALQERALLSLGIRPALVHDYAAIGDG